MPFAVRTCGDLTESLYRRVEREPLRLEETGGHRPAVADQSRQHDGTVDAAAAPLLGGERRVLQHLRQRLRNGGGAGRSRWHAIVDGTEIAGNIVPQATEIDLAGLQDMGGICILAQGEQKVLEQDLRLGLVRGVFPSAQQGRLESRRHRHSTAIFSHCLRHPPGDLPAAIGTPPQRVANPASRRNFSRLDTSPHLSACCDVDCTRTGCKCGLPVDSHAALAPQFSRAGAQPCSRPREENLAS